MRKLTVLTLAFCMANGLLFAQGVGINTSTPHPSAGLDVNFNDKGLLLPRLTNTERDAIANPADGLTIFNTSSGCFNYRLNGGWYEICGDCTPQPTAADAGADQLNLTNPSATLAGNAPGSGSSGAWSIISGSGGSFSNSSSPTSTFNGQAGESYVLEWEISNACGSAQDSVSISFIGSPCVAYAAWGNYREVTVSNSSGTAHTNFQLAVLIDHSALVGAGKAQSNGSDFRITDSGCNNVDFWIDPTTLSTSSCTLWVEVPSIPGNGSETLYLFYNKTGESSASNGPNTFVFFDDYNSGLSGYTILNGGGTAWTNGGSALRDNGVSQSGVTGPSFSSLNDWIWELNFQTPNPTALDCQVGLFDGGANGIALWILDNGTIRIVHKTSLVRIPDGSQFHSISWPLNASTHFIKVGKLGNSFSFNLNGGSTSTVSYSSGISGFSKLAGFGSSGSGRQMNYDNIRLRKNTATFPTVSVGSELP